MTRFEDAWDICGPVQAEVFVVWLNGDRLELTGPCGAEAWYIEVGEEDHPVEVVTRIVDDIIGPPLLVHSTSWRRDRTSVILSFVVIIESVLMNGMVSVPLVRAELARSSATAPPTRIDPAQVIEHGLRHMAWLVQDDPVVAEELSTAWKSLLDGYKPEPFRNLG